MSLDAAVILPALRDAGVTALKIEGRQRGRAYIAGVVRSFRGILAGLDEGRSAHTPSLAALAEGQASTVGAYRKGWR